MGTFTDHGLYRYDTVSVTSGTPSSFTIDIDPDSALSMVTLETTSTNESNNSLRIKVLDSSSFAMSVAYRMIVSGTTSTLSSSSGTTNPYLTYQYLGNLTSSFGSYEAQRATLWVTNVMSGSAPYRHPQIHAMVNYESTSGTNHSTIVSMKLRETYKISALSFNYQVGNVDYAQAESYGMGSLSQT